MIISFHSSDAIPEEVKRLNDPLTAASTFEEYVDRENVHDHRQFTVDRDEFVDRWSSWSEEMEAERFLMSTTLTYRMKHIMGALCAHLCRGQIVVADDQAGYIVEDHVRVRQSFIARYPTLYFAAYFCLSNYNLTTSTLPAQSPTPGIASLEKLFESYSADPNRARSVISDLHSFVKLELVR